MKPKGISVTIVTATPKKGNHMMEKLAGKLKMPMAAKAPQKSIDEELDAEYGSSGNEDAEGEVDLSVVSEEQLMKELERRKKAAAESDDGEDEEMDEEDFKISQAVPMA